MQIAEENKCIEIENGISINLNYANKNKIHPTPQNKPSTIKIGNDFDYGKKDLTTAELRHLDERLVITGYETSKWKTACVIFASIGTLGLFYLFLYWYPRFCAKFTCNKTPLTKCSKVLIRDDFHQNVEFQKVVLMNKNSEFISKGSQLRYFEYRKLKYIWNDAFGQFESLMNLIEKNFKSSHDLAQTKRGLNDSDVKELMEIYGPNLIQVELENFVTLLIRECITPFYLFQLFSVSIWLVDGYVPYSVIILGLTTASLTMEAYQLRKQQHKMRKMVEKTERVIVLRNYGQICHLQSDQLVPGDILAIKDPCILHSDAILISGSVTVSEAMLTGESIPQHKTAFSAEEYPVESNKAQERHILYAGTQLLQTRSADGNIVYAMVLRTGFTTAKGQLVRSLMFPKPMDIAFTRDLLKFVGVLACLASIGFIYTLILKLNRGFPLWKIIIRAFDVVTAAVPPALPVVLTIGILTAQMRLKLKQIFCTSPSSINTCGAIDTVCFDKTGTLTEDGLSFDCVHFVISPNEETEREHQMSEAISKIDYDNKTDTLTLRKACAVCHSLTNINNAINGDPLDLVLFKWSKCSMFESTDQGNTMVKSIDESNEFQMETLKTFPFRSELQRMSVIVRECNIDEQESTAFSQLYTKGSPEVVASLCRPESIPSNYRDLVDKYSLNGRRILALATRELQFGKEQVKKLRRDEAEKDLRLIGIVVLENRLKPATSKVIAQLNRANIRVVMITGDNLLTALNVARKCAIIQPSKETFCVDIRNPTNTNYEKVLISIVDESNFKEMSEVDWADFSLPPNSQLAISGPALKSICQGKNTEALHSLINNGSVFARTSPELKKFLVDQLKKSGRIVAMCGDGSNDCSALKAAHVGVSLSEAEASIAAPFTAKRERQAGADDIQCIPTLIAEGRAALVTSFGLFKYMCTYALTQFISICLIYWFDIGIALYQFLYVDLFLVTMVAIFFGQTKASTKLAKTRPPLRLLSRTSIISIFGQLAIAATFQLVALFYTMAQPWFVPFVQIDKNLENPQSMEGTAIFSVSLFQFLGFAIVYSKGPPYRMPLWTNRPMCIMLSICTLVSVLLVLTMPQFAVNILDMVMLESMKDRIAYLAIGSISVLCSLAFEMVVVDVLLERMLHVAK